MENRSKLNTISQKEDIQSIREQLIGIILVWPCIPSYYLKVGYCSLKECWVAAGYIYI